MARARTLPIKGAVAKPRAFKIRAPFPCGVKVRLNCGYGPGCSRAHRRTKSQYATPDYYALDMARVAPLNGYDQPVVAVAAGVVRYAGWAKRRLAPYGQVVYVEHFFKDREGKRYQTLYAHLRRVNVKKGQRVKAGAVLGTLGGSSRGKYLRFGAHLHFAMYRGGRRTLGGGQAVVPEPMGFQEDLRSRKRWISCKRAAPSLAAWPAEGQGELARGGLVLETEEHTCGPAQSKGRSAARR